jgi:uncharacterized protein (TIGR03067 family)
MHGESAVEKHLPSRPNRRQAKALLVALEAGEPEAVATMLGHLPAAMVLSSEQVRRTRFRLADAQSAIARKSGFASWPQLGRHVEQLRALEGTWGFISLEIDGAAVPPEGMRSSKLLMDGDRFRFECPEANYEGVFSIDVEAQPHQIDIEFVEGPEAGNWNFGIFRLEGDQLDLCLDMNGKPRPTGFCTAPGSGHAFEKLRRISTSRPDDVAGGTPGQPWSASHLCSVASSALSSAPADGAAAAQECAGFRHVASPLLTRLEGEWTATKLIRDGQELPEMMTVTGRRSANNNEVKISFGGQLMFHVLARVNEDTEPVHLDYYHLTGPGKGSVQEGIMEWRGDEACFCMAAPGGTRPGDFVCSKGSGQTLSQWRRAK